MMNVKLACVVLCFLGTALTVVGTVDRGYAPFRTRAPPPSFCGGLPCPQYVDSNDTVKSADFELRSYNRAVWVSTIMPGEWEYHAAVVNASVRLWTYYWGGNQEGLRLQETVPLTIEFK